MKVLIDARKLGDGGIGTYIENLVSGILELSRSNRAQVALSLLSAPHEGISEKSKKEYLERQQTWLDHVFASWRSLLRNILSMNI